MLPALQGPRLVLEPLVEAHAAELFPGFSDPALHTYIPTDPPTDVEALRLRYRWLERRTSPDGAERWLNWAARLGEGTYVGLFEATVHADATASLAYLVFTPHTRQGFGVEGARLVVDHLFDACGVSRITARLDTRNVGSARLVERLGFSCVGVERDADHFKGSASDEYVYVLVGPAISSSGGASRAPRSP
jgi:RimJ/RimL family protein N-acetyltransferase